MALNDLVCDEVMLRN